MRYRRVSYLFSTKKFYQKYLLGPKNVGYYWNISWKQDLAEFYALPGPPWFPSCKILFPALAKLLYLAMPGSCWKTFTSLFSSFLNRVSDILRSFSEAMSKKSHTTMQQWDSNHSNNWQVGSEKTTDAVPPFATLWGCLGIVTPSATDTVAVCLELSWFSDFYLWQSMHVYGS